MLVETRSGASARLEIGALHGKGVASPETYIGRYGPDSLRAVLYVSRFPRKRDARARFAAMARRIGAGSSGFSGHERFAMGGTDVHRLVGHGQSHYFFVRNRDLLWLSAPGGRGRYMLAELLGVKPEALPRTGALAPAPR